MSMLLRSAPLRAARIARVPQQARGVHIENKVDHTVPFNTRNKLGLALKMGIFISASFGLPFVSGARDVADGKKASGA